MQGNRQLIMYTIFGSRLYGTSNSASDYDYKGIFLPTASELLSGNPPNHQSEKKEENGKKIEIELFSLSKYLNLLCQGQTVAWDMFFAPSWAYQTPAVIEHPLWSIIKQNKDKFLHNGVSAFVGYCRGQAAMYSNKKKRYKEICDWIEFFEQFDDFMSLHNIDSSIQIVIDDLKLTKYSEIIEKDDQKFLEVCGRKFQYTNSIQYVKERLKNLADKYGKRTKRLENGDYDWKAISHAARIAMEAYQLLTGGEYHFPLENKTFINQIKYGKMSYNDVENYISKTLDLIEEVKKTSILPDKPDRKWVSDFIEKVHRGIIIKDSLTKAYY